MPSDPPYGIATTTTVCSNEFLVEAQLSNMETSNAPFCTLSSASEDITINTNINTNQYINLNTAVASSTPITEINDLLQNNCHTMPALVTLSSTSTSSCVTSERIIETDSNLELQFDVTNNTKQVTATTESTRTSTALMDVVNSSLLAENSIKMANQLMDSEGD